MFKNTLFLIIIILFISLEQIQASDDIFDYKVGVGAGIEGGQGYGYSTFLEYRHSDSFSLYLIGNIEKNMDANMETGDSKMVGMQLRLAGFMMGYHAVTQHNITSNIIKYNQRQGSNKCIFSCSYGFR